MEDTERIKRNIEFAQSLKGYTWDELVTMHKFYSLGENNQQAQDCLTLIEREWGLRCESDKPIE
jgi:hypothetical protein